MIYLFFYLDLKIHFRNTTNNCNRIPSDTHVNWISLQLWTLIYDIVQTCTILSCWSGKYNYCLCCFFICFDDCKVWKTLFLAFSFRIFLQKFDITFVDITFNDLVALIRHSQFYHLVTVFFQCSSFFWLPYHSCQVSSQGLFSTESSLHIDHLCTAFNLAPTLLLFFICCHRWLCVCTFTFNFSEPT